MKHVVLVGFMGSGKSTIGRALAKRLGRRFVDTDDLIEQERGSIARIFAREGERAFRRYERRAVASALALREPAVVAVGGGALTYAPSRRLMQRTRRVFLDVSPGVLVRRLRRSKRLRPLLGSDVTIDSIERVYQKRLPLYRAARIHVACDGLTKEKIVDAICRRLR